MEIKHITGGRRYCHTFVLFAFVPFVYLQEVCITHGGARPLLALGRVLSPTVMITTIVICWISEYLHWVCFVVIATTSNGTWCARLFRYIHCGRLHACRLLKWHSKPLVLLLRRLNLISVQVTSLLPTRIAFLVPMVYDQAVFHQHIHVLP